MARPTLGQLSCIRCLRRNVVPTMYVVGAPHSSSCNIEATLHILSRPKESETKCGGSQRETPVPRIVVDDSQTSADRDEVEL